MHETRPDTQAGNNVSMALAARGLFKRFGVKVAVDNLYLEVPRGSLFGLVGPNGAGKTTTILMATGLLRPDAGTAWVESNDVWTSPTKAKAAMGVLPEEARLFERLSGSELLTYMGLLRRLDPEMIRTRSHELLDVLGLRNDAGKLVVDYSHGMKKKIGLACALLHAPRLLILDEPFEGIDPISARTIRSVLERHVESGGAVVISSHVMELVERLCDRVAIIHEGRVIVTGPTREVRGDESLEDAFVRLVGAPEAPSGSLGWLASSQD